MPKRKAKIPWVKGFQLPNEQDVVDAIGVFPCGSKHTKREEILMGVSGGSRTTLSSVKQCDQEWLFTNKYKGKNAWKPLPTPMDETAWLANVNEEGQTFQQYVSMVTLRSGQFRPNTNHLRTKMYLVPIVDDRDHDHDQSPCWPGTGPALKGLSAWMSAFFCREVEILDAVTLEPQQQEQEKEAGQGRKRACKKKDKKQILWREAGGAGGAGRESLLEGRICAASGRFQTHVDGLLAELSYLREEGCCGGGGDGSGSCGLEDAFSVVGVTMCDLYSGADDLFVAGMAAGGSKVAVLSFARYHPMLKMCPERWQDYGYIQKSSNYSYFEDNKRRPATSAQTPACTDLPAAAQAEYFRRAGKLLIHEMCHVYGIDHCIHYHCLMNGTAHLVEDFASPCHICCICLRKLQFRLGFDIKRRYQDLNEVYKAFGMQEQVKWTSRKLVSISGEEEQEGQEEGRTRPPLCVVDLTEEEEEEEGEGGGKEEK